VLFRSTFETRPDYIDTEQFLKFGATRIEIGVQSIYDNILEKINRKSCIEETIYATKILKDAGLKVLYHMMPGLPGSDFKKDVEMFKKIFSDERFCPDMLKIYPTLVIKGTKLYKDWKEGKYKAVNEEYMDKLLLEIYKICPPWVRIMRVQRDIPAKFIEAGPKKSNLRELSLRKIKTSNEIRFREVGPALREGKIPKNIKILTKKYSASEGSEYFISIEDKKQNILIGFLRLRITKDKAIIRELHIYGETVPIGAKGEIQHAGWGKKLVAAAEKIAKQHKKPEILVTSGIGAREYYRKLGYKLNNPYMQKRL
jgi:elongator complex protein 3